MSAWRFEEDDIIQDLLILDAKLSDTTCIVVDVFGGVDHVCGTIEFSFPSLVDTLRYLRLLKQWQEEHEPVTMVARGQFVTLLSERDLFKRALSS